VTLRRRLGRLALLLALAGCTEQITAPGVCPDFCPGGQIVVVDTIFGDIIGAIQRSRATSRRTRARSCTSPTCPESPTAARFSK